MARLGAKSKLSASISPPSAIPKTFEREFARSSATLRNFENPRSNVPGDYIPCSSSGKTLAEQGICEIQKFTLASPVNPRTSQIPGNVVRHSKTEPNKMKVREEKLRTIIEWSEKNEDVRVLLLTSSLVNPLALVDEFSDLDIEFVFEDNTNYISDKSWTLKFGNPIAMIEEDESCFNHKHAMKMLLYEDGVKVDFKLYSKSKFIKETQEKELPEDWDIGYKILIDKDGITKQMLKPTYQISIIKKPSEKEFQNLINDFWWDTTYVAKCLVRDEIFYAKFMSETVIRTEYLIPLIEWHIASEHNWNITTNKYGRLFKKYLNQEMWAKTEQTFSGSDIKENWTALFSMTDLVSEIGTELSKKLEYKYPDKLENDIRKYLAGLKPKT